VGPMVFWISNLKHEWNEAINRDLGHCVKCSRRCDSKWIFKIKRDEHGDVSSYKARLVIIGFEQEYSINFDQVFKTNTLRCLLALAATNDLEIQQVDRNRFSCKARMNLREEREKKCESQKQA
jgi:hypothetical protein